MSVEILLSGSFGFPDENGGAAETKEFDALAVEEKMELESQKSDSSVCIKFLLDFGTFHRKEFTLLRNT